MALESGFIICILGRLCELVCASPRESMLILQCDKDVEGSSTHLKPILKAESAPAMAFPLDEIASIAFISI